MAHAIRIHQPGGPEVMKYEEVTVGSPGAGQIKVKNVAIGLNFIDVYHRTGLYPMPLPFTPGMSGAGVISEIGPEVVGFKVGDRVGYAQPIGSYATERLMPADRAVKIPDGLSEKTVAGMMLQGMTVRYLLKDTFKVTKDTVLLFHAAAGAVGLIACQWARHLGATLIATAGSPEKCALAKSHGATHVINYRTENFVDRVKEITGGKLCDVVYDSVGKDTFPGSLDCLKPRGLFVTFGNSSGPVKAFDAGLLSQKGSLFMTRPTLMTYVAKRSDLEANAADLFDVVKSGAIKVEVAKSYKLADAPQAHRDLEARKTTGSTILLP